MVFQIIKREIQKKNRHRYNLFLSDGRVVGVSIFVVGKLGLKTGDELSEKDLGNILKKDLIFRGREKALKLLAVRPRSAKEAEKRLERYFRKISDREKLNRLSIKKIIKKLKAGGFLNDKDFCHWWIEQRTGVRPSSKKKIIWELRRKGLALPVIHTALDEFHLDETKLGRRLLKKYISRPSFKKLSAQKAESKAKRWLLSKGFSFSTIREVIDGELKFK